jgi:hypothetical protein
MKTLARCTAFALALFAIGASAQMNSNSGSMPMPAAQSAAPAKPLLSPNAMAETKLDGKSITIHYNSPAMRGRKIMGALVPYDKVWRTGANPATSFVTEANLKVGDLNVPAGSYTLYTLPEAPGKPWKLIINKQTGQWGTVYTESMDLGRTPMMSKPLATPQESMSISFEHVHGNTAELHVRWDKTDEWVKIELAK